jgi:UDP-glucose 4-epimerase
MPYVCLVPRGERPFLSVDGNDYPTVDGTGVRDYVHACDVAEAHVAAMDWLGGVHGFHHSTWAGARATASWIDLSAMCRDAWRLETGSDPECRGRVRPAA